MDLEYTNSCICSLKMTRWIPAAHEKSSLIELVGYCLCVYYNSWGRDNTRIWFNSVAARSERIRMNCMNEVNLVVLYLITLPRVDVCLGMLIVKFCIVNPISLLAESMRSNYWLNLQLHLWSCLLKLREKVTTEVINK